MEIKNKYNSNGIKSKGCGYLEKSYDIHCIDQLIANDENMLYSNTSEYKKVLDIILFDNLKEDQYITYKLYNKYGLLASQIGEYLNVSESAIYKRITRMNKVFDAIISKTMEKEIIDDKIFDMAVAINNKRRDK